MQEADAEMSVVGVVFRGGVGGLEVEDRFTGGRAVMLDSMSMRQDNWLERYDLSRKGTDKVPHITTYAKSRNVYATRL